MRVAVAGTFGPIHDGHRALFRAALRFGEAGVVVALTDDDLARRTRSEPGPIPSIAARRAAVERELTTLDDWGRAIEIRILHDEHGIASTDPDLDALVVSPETVTEVEAINTERRDRDLDSIYGIVVPYVLAADGKRISSTRVVNGEIDEHGQPTS